MNRCPCCSSPTRDVFCSDACAENHRAMGRVLIAIDGEIVEVVHRFAREIGGGLWPLWDRMIVRALDEAGAH